MVQLLSFRSYVCAQGCQFSGGRSKVAMEQCNPKKIERGVPHVLNLLKQGRQKLWVYPKTDITFV